MVFHPLSSNGAQGDYIFSHFYDVAIASTKLSILALYWRIFATVRFRAAVAVTAAVVFCWLVAIEVALGLGCQPIQGWWDAAAASGSCVDKVAFTYSTNSINLATDFWVFAMPLPVILGLQASMDRRIGLCFLFSVGLGTVCIFLSYLSSLVSIFGVPSVPEFRFVYGKIMCQCHVPIGRHPALLYKLPNEIGNWANELPH